MKTFSNHKIVFAAFLILTSCPFVFAQSSGGVFAITQSVIATGGGQNSAGGVFSLDGTIGQSAAGGNLSGGTNFLTSGFWNADSFAPTAAAVSISGQITTADGHGLPNALVTLTGMNGTSRTVGTGSFGYFRFDEAAAGETYIVSVSSKRFQFAPQVISVSEDLTDLNFTALPQ